MKNRKGAYRLNRASLTRYLQREERRALLRWLEAELIRLHGVGYFSGPWAPTTLHEAADRNFRARFNERLT